MDVSKLRGGELIAAIGGVVLLVALLFLNWYGVGGSVETGFGEIEVGGEFGAWDGQGFFGTLANLVILAAGVFAVGLALLTAASRTVALPIAASALTALLGFGAVAMVLLRMLLQPGDGEFVDLEFGIYLALIGAVAVAYGGWQSMKEEGTTFQDARDRLQPRMEDEGPVSGTAAAPGPELEGSTAPPGRSPAEDAAPTPGPAVGDARAAAREDEIAMAPPPGDDMPVAPGSPAADAPAAPENAEVAATPEPIEEPPPPPPPAEEPPPSPPPAEEPPETHLHEEPPTPAPEAAEVVPEEPAPAPEPSPPASPGEAPDEEEESRPPGL